MSGDGTNTRTWVSVIFLRDWVGVARGLKVRKYCVMVPLLIGGGSQETRILPVSTAAAMTLMGGVSGAAWGGANGHVINHVTSHELYTYLLGVW